MLPEADFSAFMKLEHHLDEFQRKDEEREKQTQNTWENIQLMSRAALEYSGSKEPRGMVESMTARASSSVLSRVSPRTPADDVFCLSRF